VVETQKCNGQRWCEATIRSSAHRSPLLRCSDEFIVRGFYFLGEAFEGFLGSGEIANSALVDIPSLFKSSRDSLGYLPTGENPARSLSGCTCGGGLFDEVIGDPLLGPSNQAVPSVCQLFASAYPLLVRADSASGGLSRGGLPYRVGEFSLLGLIGRVRFPDPQGAVGCPAVALGEGGFDLRNSRAQCGE
jgi:hypothetical protein